MSLFSRIRPGTLLLILALLAAPLQATGDRKFTTSPTLATEARTMVRLLEQAHYNRDGVRSADYSKVITDYMGSLDGQRLFFLGEDQAAFEQRHSKSIYWNVSTLGNIDAAYEIFSVYEQRTSQRINWIFDVLQREEFDLNGSDLYQLDRTKAAWPANANAADELWRQRLKFELIGELLNAKTPEEARQNVRKRYERMLKNLADIEGSDLAELYLTTIARLYDPHTLYFSADTFEDFGIQMKLELVGIGAVLGLEDDYCVVKEVVPGGPADLSKQIKPNDRILAVAQGDGESIEIIGMKLRKIVDQIRGAKDTQVRLLIQPAAAPDPATRKEVVITRDLVKLNSARAHASVFQVPDQNGSASPIGVITLPSFYGPADEGDTDSDRASASLDIAQLITRLQASGIKGLVLDLRRNGGGFLAEAIDVAGLFINRGPVVQVKNYAGQIQVDSDESDAIAYDGPLAVLVDRFSASASEIVAGALQNYGRAIIIGDRSTHGKGSVQTILEMKNLVPQLARSPLKTGATKLTVQKYYLPNGNSTQLKGVVPDIILPSIEDFLPIGESDMPNALVWDEIPSTLFDGQPLAPELVASLRSASHERQNTLEEFSYLQRNVDWFQNRQQQKLVTLNLEKRREQKEADTAFRKEMAAERQRLATMDYPREDIYIVPPPVEEETAAVAAMSGDPEDAEAEALSIDETDGKVDVHLKEALRIVHDAIGLAENHRQWLTNRAPLTAQTDPKG